MLTVCVVYCPPACVYLHVCVVWQSREGPPVSRPPRPASSQEEKQDHINLLEDAVVPDINNSTQPQVRGQMTPSPAHLNTLTCLYFIYISSPSLISTLILYFTLEVTVVILLLTHAHLTEVSLAFELVRITIFCFCKPVNPLNTVTALVKLVCCAVHCSVMFSSI